MSVRRLLARRANAAVLVLVTGVAAGGCAAAVPLASAAIAAAPLFGSRSVERTVGADMQAAWGAVEQALTDMAFRVETREPAEAEWRLRAVAEKVTVEAVFERVTSRLTRVTLRVEAGGFLADRKTADVIHNQILKLLDGASRATVSPSTGGAPSEALLSLEAEVRRLRTEIEDRGSIRPPADGAASQAPVLRVDPSAMITVPPSAALPSVTGPVPPVSVVRPAGAITPTVSDVPVAATPDETSPSLGSERLAPLRPADALMPVRPVSVPGSGT
jgi:hypothetical protein